MSDPTAPSNAADVTLSDFDLESLSLALSSIAQTIVRDHMEWANKSMEATNAQMLQAMNAANMQMMQAMQMGMPQMGMGMMGMPQMGMMGMPQMGMPQMPMGMPNMPHMPGQEPNWTDAARDAGGDMSGAYGQPGQVDVMQQDMKIIQKRAEVIELLKRFLEPAEILAKAGKDRLKTVVDEYVAGLVAQTEAQRKHMAEMHADNVRTQDAISGIQNNMHETNMKSAQARQKLQMDTAIGLQKTTAEGLAAQQKSFHDSNELIRKALKGELY